MFDFRILSNTKAQFLVDPEIYSDSVISKVCYWLNTDFIVSSNKKGDYMNICIESVKNEVEWSCTQQIISQMFSDYKLREIIDFETKDIRTVLYVKAFANLDDFEEYGE